MSYQFYLYLEPYDSPTYLKGGTLEQLAAAGIILAEGLRLTFYEIDASDEGEIGRQVFEGTVHYDHAKQSWYAIHDPTTFRFEPNRTLNDPSSSVAEN